MKRCEKCGRPYRRSDQANRRYWALINVIAEKVRPDGQQFNPATWHRQAKLKFLPMQEFVLPYGAIVLEPPSTARLDADEFAAYVLQVEAWAAENGAWLPD